MYLKPLSTASVTITASGPRRSASRCAPTTFAPVEMTRRLAHEEGIFAGISSGANVVGANRLAERLGPEAVIVTLAVDTGFKYMSVSPYADG